MGIRSGRVKSLPKPGFLGVIRDDQLDESIFFGPRQGKDLRIGHRVLYEVGQKNRARNLKLSRSSHSGTRR